MSDKLRARAQELAERVDRDLNSAKSINVDPVAHIKSAILAGMREALEPDDKEALNAASLEVQRMLLREGSLWGTKACEEVGRVFMVAYGRARGLE